MGTLPRHSHHSVQVAIAREGEFLIEDAAGRRRQAQAAVVPPNQAHAFASRGAVGLVGHVEPESNLGKELSGLVDDPEAVESWCRAGSRLQRTDDLWREGHLSLASAATPPTHPTHPALAATLAVLGACVEAGPVRLKAVAAEVGISESRLAHLFASDLGLTFRAYVRWLRLQRAVVAIAGGASLTEAAHTAGFSDSSHLTRVCRRAFGAAPSAFGELSWQVQTR